MLLLELYNVKTLTILDSGVGVAIVIKKYMVSLGKISHLKNYNKDRIGH